MVDAAKKAFDDLLSNDAQAATDNSNRVSRRILNGIRACSPFITKAMSRGVDDVMGEVDAMLRATNALFVLVANRCDEQKIAVADEQWGVVNALCIDLITRHWPLAGFSSQQWAALIVKLMSDEQLFVYRRQRSMQTPEGEALAVDIHVTGTLLLALAPCIDIDTSGEEVLKQLAALLADTTTACMAKIAKYHVPQADKAAIHAELVIQGAHLLSAVIASVKVADEPILFDQIIERFKVLMHIFTASIYVNSRMMIS
jgi:hypothetical protein